MMTEARRREKQPSAVRLTRNATGSRSKGPRPGRISRRASALALSTVFIAAPSDDHWCGKTHNENEYTLADAETLVKLGLATNKSQFAIDATSGWRLCGSSLRTCKKACSALGRCAEMSVSRKCCFFSRSHCVGKTRKNDHKYLLKEVWLPPSPAPKPAQLYTGCSPSVPDDLPRKWHVALKDRMLRTFNYTYGISDKLPSIAVSKRVAILVSGTFRRFFLKSTANNLVRPMVRQGHTVDFFGTLATGEHTPWKADARPYLNHLTWDPIFGEPSPTLPTDVHIRSIITETITSAGGSAVQLKLLDAVSLDDDARLRSLRWEARRRFPDEDPDARFPTRSLAGKGVTSTVADANRNMLRLFRALEWTFDAMEMRESYTTPYDLVFVMRDDTNWLQPLDLNKLLRFGGPEAELHVPACSRRWLRSPKEPGAAAPMIPSEMCDHVQLLTRKRAALLGRYYSRYFEHRNRCSMPRKIESTVTNTTLRRPCTSEELLRWTMVTAGVKFHEAMHALLPYERSAHVNTLGFGVIVCYHKACLDWRGASSSQRGAGRMANLGPYNSLATSFCKVASGRTVTLLPQPNMTTTNSRRMCQDPYIVRRLPTMAYKTCEKELRAPKTDGVSAKAAQKRLAIYTINTGGYDPAPAYDCHDAVARMSHSFRSRFNVSCLFVTDSRSLARAAMVNGAWAPVLLPRSRDPLKQQRKLKILGIAGVEQVLPDLGDFDFVVYHDGKDGIRAHPGNTSGLDSCVLEQHLHKSLELIASGKVEIVAYAHQKRRRTAEEMAVIANRSYCSARSIRFLRKLHRAEGFPDNAGLADTKCIVRRERGRSQAAQQGMVAWVHGMEVSGCMRDQLNFEFAMWKLNVSYKLLPSDASPFVTVREHTLRYPVVKARVRASL